MKRPEMRVFRRENIYRKRKLSLIFSSISSTRVSYHFNDKILMNNVGVAFFCACAYDNSTIEVCNYNDYFDGNVNNCA